MYSTEKYKGCRCPSQAIEPEKMHMAGGAQEAGWAGDEGWNISTTVTQDPETQSP